MGSARTGLPLSWVLAGIAQVESLRSHLAFKGGTALKKCYFGDYRFSEDLDFSALTGVPSGAAMESAIKAACEAAAKLLDEYASVEITSERYAEKESHPGGQEAFIIRARFPRGVVVNKRDVRSPVGEHRPGSRWFLH